jgi:hypothetical protein
MQYTDRSSLLIYELPAIIGYIWNTRPQSRPPDLLLKSPVRAPSKLTQDQKFDIAYLVFSPLVPLMPEPAQRIWEAAFATRAARIERVLGLPFLARAERLRLSIERPMMALREMSDLIGDTLALPISTIMTLDVLAQLPTMMHVCDFFPVPIPTHEDVSEGLTPILELDTVTEMEEE